MTPNNPILVHQLGGTDVGKIEKIKCNSMMISPNVKIIKSDSKYRKKPTIRFSTLDPKTSFKSDRAKRNWFKLKNVIKGVNLMRKNDVRTITDPNEILSEIVNLPAKISISKRSTSNFGEFKV